MTQSGGRGGRGGRGGGGRGPAHGRPSGGRSGGGRGGGGGGGGREARKAGRRAKQVAAMEKKSEEEDRYYRQCQRDPSKHEDPPPSAAELFGKQGAAGINFKKYDDIKVEVRSPGGDAAAAAPLSSFDSVGGMPDFLRANIGRMNYTSPTPIQRHSVPLASAGEDLMCCAQTGSGKTCAFLLPVVSSMTRSAGRWGGGGWGGEVGDPASPSCVVLAPTRELALQIELEAQKLTHVPDREDVPVDTVCVYGGAKARGQLQQLAVASRRPSAALLVVATPGRLTDFVERNLVSLNDVAFLVLDEADRMLDMGFEPQIRRLVQRSGMPPPSRRQTLLFSATFPPAIQKLAAEFLRPNYSWIAVGRVGSTTSSIKQVVLRSTSGRAEKLKLTVKALRDGPEGRTLIFVKKKRDATKLKKQLCSGGPREGRPDERFPPIKAQDIHGDRTQSQRETALAEFRQGSVLVLVATDVAARGLDISGVEHVINVDLPNAADEFDSYVHRIGRTGRAGHTGLATSLYVPGDDPKTGNGRIAGLLVAQLRESKQDVPDWLAGEAAGGRPPASAGGGPGHKRKGGEFGGTDVRGSGKKAEGPGRNQRRNGGGGGGQPRGGGGSGKDQVTGSGSGGRGGGRGSSSSGGGGGRRRGRAGGGERSFSSQDARY